ncbi:MAG: hypothetical protein ACHQF2_00430 [Flavobacteriales bacterium]
MPKYNNLSLSKMAKIIPVIVLFVLIFRPFSGYCDTLTVHFLYGSKPAKGHKTTESKWFGGLHGGHVTIQLGAYLYGFGPSGSGQVFSHRKKFRSYFQKESYASWVRDTAQMKYMSIKIPVDTVLLDSLQQIFDRWVESTPHDYAFFGMRCASTAYNGLSKIGVVHKRGRFGMTYKYFYPKLLRKYLLKKSKSRKWSVIAHRGRKTRKWEGD